MALELWIPDSAKETGPWCHLCERRWPDQAKFLRHLKGCVSKHYDEIEEYVARRRDPEHGATVFDTHADPERYHYERKRAARKKLKGIRGVR